MFLLCLSKKNSKVFFSLLFLSFLYSFILTLFLFPFLCEGRLCHSFHQRAGVFRKGEVKLAMERINEMHGSMGGQADMFGS